MNTRIAIALIVCVLATGCGNDNASNPADTFDRSAMLTKLADEQIIPGYTTLMYRVDTCAAACDRLIADPTPTNVATAWYSWVQLHYAWSTVQQFDLGPAESSSGNLSISVATFPVNAQRIEAKITAGDTSTVNYDRDCRGIYGVEYLLFGVPADSVQAASAFAAQPLRGAYLRSIMRDVQQRISSVLSAWKSGYRASFIANNGTAIGSSVSLVFNEMNKSYENIKNYKWGIPLGMSPGQSGPEPAKVECYYASKTREYENLSQAATRLHLGGVIRTWEYFKPYLSSVPGGSDLIQRTTTQIDTVQRALDALPMEPALSVQVSSSPAAALKVYTELQKLTRFFKSEMSSRLGIAITYSSGDGD